MNPLVPVNDRAYLKQYADAGGEEFYIGFHDQAWSDRFGCAADLNRMTGFGSQANPYSFEEVLGIVEEVRALGKKLYVTFNANFYDRARLDFIFGYFERLAEVGAAGVIVSVPEAVQPAADCGLEVVASTMCGVYNASIARFYRELGCSRVIIPRDCSLADIEAVMEAEPELEYEAFLMRNGCIFADGLCLGRHARERSALCWDVRHAEREFFVASGGEGVGGAPAGGTGSAPGEVRSASELAMAARENNEAYGRFHQTACGLCAVYRLLHAGVSAAKIVGRSDDSSFILRDIRAVARNVAIARDCADEREYLARMHVPPERERCCADGLSCYYPEVRFPRAEHR